MLNQPTCYLSPRAKARLKTHREYGVYARERIQKDEMIAVWGGEVVTQEKFDTLPDRLRRLSIQVEENLFLVALNEGPADYVNHSCDPNAGLSGQIVLVAMRDIAPGEEITFDYAMSDVTDYDEFQCDCGAPNCRGYFRGTDWRNPALWKKYAGYFSPYIQRRIERLQRGEPVE
ncbi:MAG TPA: SET domain-containing protein-lysine N-methyltransferase [Anaerolineae bacterium]|nr:SET domain-containing protein-lysine N-methyltransferase [Anaerolineae bacterium]